MSANPSKLALVIRILILLAFLSPPLLAQVAATLSGTVTNQGGAAVPNAKISVKNLATGQSAETQSDSSGLYNVPNLTPGDYEVSVSAEGFPTTTVKVTIAQAATQTLNLTLAGALSLGDLSFSQAQAQGSAQDQARLGKRSHMLKVHQRIGLIATASIVASVITGTFAGGKSTSSTDRWTHLALGSAAGDRVQRRITPSAVGAAQ